MPVVGTTSRKAAPKQSVRFHSRKAAKPDEVQALFVDHNEYGFRAMEGDYLVYQVRQPEVGQEAIIRMDEGPLADQWLLGIVTSKLKTLWKLDLFTPKGFKSVSVKLKDMATAYTVLGRT